MGKITQLFEHLEMLSEDNPLRHTLFVRGKRPGMPERLLLIDPPADVTERFELAEQVAAIFTGSLQEVHVPLVEVKLGEVTHLQVGQHLLDIYTGRYSSAIHMPALGLVCGGMFGSNLSLPRIGREDDGSAALESLRLLARLVREHRLQIYIPHIGSLARDRVEAMGRLAEDVSYLHGLRRVIPAAVRRGDDLETVQELAGTLLPENRRTFLCQEIHERNIEQLYHQANRLP
jgi:hypothetical protein